jgi:hypothetical protein
VRAARRRDREAEAEPEGRLLKNMAKVGAPAKVETGA